MSDELKPDLIPLAPGFHGGSGPHDSTIAPPPPTETPSPQQSRSRRRLALAAMLFAVAMTFIDQTIVSIASANIQDNLGLTHAQTQWGVNAYLLGLAATFALGGRLADIFGSRRMVVIGIVGFAASSGLCGATPSGKYAESWLIVFRAVQGVSGALMIPAALAVVSAAFPIEQRGRAIATFFGLSGALTAIGPLAGGYLTQWTWRSVFWINIPVALIALILAARAHIPQVSRPARVDLIGAVLVAGAMVASVLGFEQAATWGWSSDKTIGLFAGSVVLFAAFGVREMRTSSPLLRLEIFRGRAFIVDNAVLFFSNIAFVPVFFFASLYAQISLGMSAKEAGIYLVVFFAGFAPATQIGGRMLDRRGARGPLVAGSIFAIAGFVYWAAKIEDLHLSAQWPGIAVAGFGLGLLISPASTDAVNRAIGASYGEVTGITQSVRNYASSLGLAVLGTVFGTVYANATQTARPSAADIGLRYADATRAVLIGMAIALGLCLLAALAHPGDRVVAQDAGRTEDPSITPHAATPRG